MYGLSPVDILEKWVHRSLCYIFSWLQRNACTNEKLV